MPALYRLGLKEEREAYLSLMGAGYSPRPECESAMVFPHYVVEFHPRESLMQNLLLELYHLSNRSPLVYRRSFYPGYREAGIAAGLERSQADYQSKIAIERHSRRCAKCFIAIERYCRRFFRRLLWCF